MPVSRPGAAQQALEIEMESKLSPRDIQSRIRAGESLDEVAQAAGVPAEQIEVFASPVIAEREHVAGSALNAPVRRTGESSSGRGLKAVVAARLAERGIEPGSVTWDAWRNPDRRWTIRASYESGSAPHEAHFVFDPRARFSVASDDEAKWLLGEPAQAHGPQPGRKPRDPDAEPTLDLNDQLALVRAVQPDVDAAPLLAGEAEVTGTEAARTEVTVVSDEPADYAEADLEEVDGVYDLVVRGSDMDVLYEMLSGFDEDSVNVYAGLTQPVVEELIASETQPSADEVAAAQQASDDTTVPVTEGDEEPAESDARAEELDVVEEESAEPVAAEDAPEPVPSDAESPEAEPAPTTEPAAITEPEQDSLLDAAESTPEPQPAPKPRAAKKKGRASIPSWDEIMFGGPTK